MPTLVALPVEAGERIVVEVDQADVASDLTLASPEPGQTAATLATTLEAALENLNPTRRSDRRRRRHRPVSGMKSSVMVDLLPTTREHLGKTPASA